MLLELVNNGPIAVGFNARGLPSSPDVWSGCSNPNAPQNHAVIIVGYGIDKKSNKKFWIAKNSWGTVRNTQFIFKMLQN